MYFKVEKTGCTERKGMVQIRYCLYLDEGDYGYDKHYVEVPIIPEEGYPGKVFEDGMPLDQTDYAKWSTSLPTEMQLNPFHNHFVQVEPTVTDEEVKYVGELALQMAREKWDKDEKPNVKNQPVNHPKIVTAERKLECETRIEAVKISDIQTTKAVK